MNIILWILIPIWIIWLIYMSYCIYMGLVVYKDNHRRSMDYGQRCIVGNIIIIIINLIVMLAMLVWRQ